jgi:hypothetical protein
LGKASWRPSGIFMLYFITLCPDGQSKQALAVPPRQPILSAKSFTVVVENQIAGGSFSHCG